jgi:hypothetical protein
MLSETQTDVTGPDMLACLRALDDAIPYLSSNSNTKVWPVGPFAESLRPFGENDISWLSENAIRHPSSFMCSKQLIDVSILNDAPTKRSTEIEKFLFNVATNPDFSLAAIA